MPVQEIESELVNSSVHEALFELVVERLSVVVTVVEAVGDCVFVELSLMVSSFVVDDVIVSVFVTDEVAVTVSDGESDRVKVLLVELVAVAVSSTVRREAVSVTEAEPVEMTVRDALWLKEAVRDADIVVSLLRVNVHDFVCQAERLNVTSLVEENSVGEMTAFKVSVEVGVCVAAWVFVTAWPNDLV